jgi:hypothetical protein
MCWWPCRSKTRWVFAALSLCGYHQLVYKFCVLHCRYGILLVKLLICAACCLCFCSQVLRMSPEEVFAARQRVLDLAEHLNRRTLQVLQTFMPMESDAPQAQAKKQ